MTNQTSDEQFEETINAAEEQIAQYEAKIADLRTFVEAGRRVLSKNGSRRNDEAEQLPNRAIVINFLRDNASKKWRSREIAEATGLTLKQVQIAFKGFKKTKVPVPFKKMGAVYYKYDKSKEAQL